MIKMHNMYPCFWIKLTNYDNHFVRLEWIDDLTYYFMTILCSCKLYLTFWVEGKKTFKYSNNSLLLS